MASPSTPITPQRLSPWWRSTVRQLPILVRRGCAFVVEVSFIVGSAGIPYGFGAYATQREIGEPVPLSPVLAATEDRMARLLSLPVRQPNRNVSPLTNLFWTGALVMPLLAGGWQIYLLSKTGQTDPKRWFGVKVVDSQGRPPSLVQIMLREAIARWGVFGGSAWLLWRVTGAFPDLGILLGLTGAILLAEALASRFNRQGRALHDRLAQTYVLDALDNPYGDWQQGELERDRHWTQVEGEAVSAIVVYPHPEPQPRAGGSLWLWMLRNPATTLLLVLLFCLTAVLGTFVGTQVYIQQQANSREFQEQDNQMFLSLVDKLTPAAGAADGRRDAILALGTLNDPRALSLLVDLLGQETEPELIDATQQAIASRGTTAIVDLRRLNQSLKTQLDSLEYGGTAEEKALLARRLRATQRAIATILSNHSGELPTADLSRTHLGQAATEVPFTLVLDGVDLAGIRFRSSVLTRASFQGSQFYGAGEDGRFGTYDDWIADLSGADLSYGNFAGATLTHVWMYRSNLMQGNFNHADLRFVSATGSNFSSAQLVGANLEGASLRQTSFTGADLNAADFTNSDLQGASLTQVRAGGSLWSSANVSQANWQGADLAGADFSRGNLSNSNFRDANLSGANLRRANLEYASFHGSDLSWADLRGANVSGADFQGVTWEAAASEEESEFVVRSDEAQPLSFVEGVNFSRARNLDREAVAFLCDRGAIHPDCP
ncbi:pentapeptide repeat-containing protein [Sodalinema gerasimenkoae]|uniref:pentapeptide repeat-containing protein n=1 Tax=Sodalinema gerasimenkoae TaxID=2862348 RepID=UPI00135C8352|nr:pentapeptide repeat-containing protein [Sodalinema gerasimenkoae]